MPLNPWEQMIWDLPEYDVPEPADEDGPGDQYPRATSPTTLPTTTEGNTAGNTSATPCPSTDARGSTQPV